MTDLTLEQKTSGTHLWGNVGDYLLDGGSIEDYVERFCYRINQEGFNAAGTMFEGKRQLYITVIKLFVHMIHYHEID